MVFINVKTLLWKLVSYFATEDRNHLMECARSCEIWTYVGLSTICWSIELAIPVAAMWKAIIMILQWEI
jgi:hypothetical protein